MEPLSVHMLADQGDIWSSELIIQRAKVVKAGFLQNWECSSAENQRKF